MLLFLRCTGASISTGRIRMGFSASLTSLLQRGPVPLHSIKEVAYLNRPTVTLSPPSARTYRGLFRTINNDASKHNPSARSVGAIITSPQKVYYTYQI